MKNIPNAYVKTALIDPSIQNILFIPMEASSMKIESLEVVDGINSINIPDISTGDTIINTLTAGVGKLTAGKLNSSGIVIGNQEFTGTLAIVAGILTATITTPNIMNVGDAVLIEPATTTENFNNTGGYTQEIHFVTATATNGTVLKLGPARKASATGTDNVIIRKLSYPCGLKYPIEFFGTVTLSGNKAIIKASLPYARLMKHMGTTGGLVVDWDANGQRIGNVTFPVLPFNSTDGTFEVDNSDKNFNSFNTQNGIKAYIRNQNGFSYFSAIAQNFGDTAGAPTMTLKAGVVEGKQAVVTILLGSDIVPMIDII